MALICTLERHSDEDMNAYDSHLGDEILIPARRSGGEMFCEAAMGAFEKRLTNDEVRNIAGIVHFLHQRLLSDRLRRLRFARYIMARLIKKLRDTRFQSDWYTGTETKATMAGFLILGRPYFTFYRRGGDSCRPCVHFCVSKKARSYG